MGLGTGIAHPVYLYATGLATGVSGFDLQSTRQHRIQTGLGPTYFPIPWEHVAPFPEVWLSAPETDHSLPRIADGKETMELYLYSPIHFHDVMHN
jgi:hypothetical protein